MTEQAITMLQLRLSQVYPDNNIYIDTERTCKHGKIRKFWWLGIEGIIKMREFDSWALLERYANWLIFVKSDEDLDPEIPVHKQIKDDNFMYPKNRIGGLI